MKVQALNTAHVIIMIITIIMLITIIMIIKMIEIM